MTAYQLSEVVEIHSVLKDEGWSETWVKANLYHKLYNVIAQEKMIETSKGKRRLSSQDVFLISDTGLEKEGVKELVQGFHNHAVPIGEENSNKGTFGKVLAFCGSDNYIGASYLACLSVLKIGAGLCALSTTDKVIDSVSKMLPELVYLKRNPKEIS